MAHTFFSQFRYQRLTWGLFGLSVLAAVGWPAALPKTGWAQSDRPTTNTSAVQITVNSPADGPIRADNALTLREAIEILNGTLPVSALSDAEQQQLSPSAQATSHIHFNLPVDQTSIELTGILPTLMRSNVVIDGSTQPGYDPERSATAEIEIPIPLVTLRPETGTEIFRGLTLAADNITIRGLNLYGFNAVSQITQSTPPADIFISHKAIPLNRETELPETRTIEPQQEPPKGIVIEHNWLGITRQETLPDSLSGFGVSVFDSTDTTIRENRIGYHNGSAIITGRQADNLQVLDNIIVGNGLSGMPDAIRLDGSVDQGLISGNLMCGNDGSGIFLFKPEGSITITDNDIRFNGQRLRRAAVYVMGSNHRITDNTITHQKGGGVVVTAFGQGSHTQSTNNVITNNRFESLEGLSVDLNTRRARAVQDFQRGDGPNPRRNSHQRRHDTGNSAVNAPEFISPEFFVIDGKVVIRGYADPRNEVELYRAKVGAEHHGPLTEPVATVTADETGAFEFVRDDLTGGEVLSAIATDPQYGTSEPALNTTVRSLNAEENTGASAAGHSAGHSADQAMPQCTTAPQPPQAPPPPAAPPVETPARPATPPPPAAIQLEVPRNVHFGLDEDFINPQSAVILDQIAAVMKQYPSLVVDLHGHTDSRASHAYNQDLARRRATNARRYLLNQGIGAERMTLRSFGETELLVEETDRVNYARNRRVEFVFNDLQGAEITFVDQENDLQIEP